MNIEDKLSSILSNEIAKSIDAEIISKLKLMTTNEVRKKSIKKIFKR